MKTQVQGPIIKRWNRGIEIVRAGRGYSKAELEEVGLRDVRAARNHGIPVDALRNTNYPENVEQLRAVAKTIIDSEKCPENQKLKNAIVKSGLRSKERHLPPGIKNRQGKKHRNDVISLVFTECDIKTKLMNN